MFWPGATLGINHVLRQQQWAAERLRPFAGRRLTVRCLPLPELRLAIREDGLLEGARGGHDPGVGDDLTVTLRPSALPQLLRPEAGKLPALREALLREAEIVGPDDLAEVVRLLARDLEWDIEEDLSKVFGDALAHRMASSGRKLAAWPQEAGMRLAQNFAEYWTEENPMIARRADLEAFSTSVSGLAEAVDRLEQRLADLRAKG